MNTNNDSPKKQDKNLEELTYLSNEDIYNQDKRISMDDEGNVISNEDAEVNQAEAEMVGANLDVPGAELDDENEVIGEEDEENNYYSLGGDNHDDLEEDNG